MAVRTALLFPGQGSYTPGSHSTLVGEFPGVRETLDRIDAVCVEQGRGPVSSLLTDPAAKSLEELVAQRSEDLDLALFAGGVATFEILRAVGVRADVMVGHSFGELPALTAAGALGVADAARLVCMRSAILRRLGPAGGGMVAVAVDRRRAESLVGLLDDPTLAVAVDNGPGQCVISGPGPLLADVIRVCQAVGVRATRLPAAYPFHNPLLRDAAAAIAAEAAVIPLSEPSCPVYSPILDRYVESVADLRLLSQWHLTGPVQFYDGLLRLHRDGVRTFVEVGHREMLVRLVRASLPAGLTAGVTAVAALRRNGTATEVARELREAEVAVPRPAVTVPAQPSGSDETLAAPKQPAAPDRDELVAELRLMYADLLGLPEELLAGDVDLEADLGIDSIKQIETFEEVRRRYHLAEPAEDLRVTSFTTLARLADLVGRLEPAGASDGR